MKVQDFITNDKDELAFYNSRIKKLFLLSLLLIPLGIFFALLANKFYNLYFHVTFLSLTILYIVLVYWYSFKSDILIVLNKNGIWYKNSFYKWSEIRNIESYKITFVNFVSFNDINENKKIIVSLFFTIGASNPIMQKAQYFVKANHTNSDIETETSFVPLIQTLYEGIDEGFVPSIIYIVSLFSSISIQFFVIWKLGKIIFLAFNLFHISEGKDKIELYKPTIDSILQTVNGSTVVFFDSITYPNYYYKVNRTIGNNGEITEKNSFINANPLITRGKIKQLEFDFPLAIYPKLVNDFNNCLLPVNRFISSVPNEVSENEILFWNDKSTAKFLEELYTSKDSLQAFLYLLKEFDSCKADFDNVFPRCRVVTQENGRDTLMQYCKKGIAYQVKEDVSRDYRANKRTFGDDEKVYLNIATTTILGIHKSKLYIPNNGYTLFGYVTIPIDNEPSTCVNIEIESFGLSPISNTIGYNPSVIYPECKKLPLIKIMNEINSNVSGRLNNRFHLFFLRKNSNKKIIDKIKKLYNDDKDFEKYYNFCVKLNECFVEDLFEN